jgi:N-acetylmuramoyl-L-alanine amidase
MYDFSSCYDDETCIARVQEIQNLHIDSKWPDIGYHFLVGENGKVYEGRGWNREGAYAPSWSNASYGER